MSAAINHAKLTEFRLLIVKTTAPQLPAGALFVKLGFSEAARSFLGKYELVWFELPL